MLLLGSLEVIAFRDWAHFFNLTSWLVVENLEPGANSHGLLLSPPYHGLLARPEHCSQVVGSVPRW
jgi:hypothetical protein